MNIIIRHKYLLIPALYSILTFILLISCISARPVYGADNCGYDLTVTTSATGSTAALFDRSYRSSMKFTSGDYLILTSDTPFSNIYIEWNTPISDYTISYSGISQTCGEYGFIHEYISLLKDTDTVRIDFTSDVSISGIYAFSDDNIPDFVQYWEPPCTKADILLLSSHADDEILFFGSILPEYAGERGLAVQVAYFSQYWNSDRIREHEKLDGLWTCGVRNYPASLGFDDIYCETLEQAMNIFDYDKALEKTVELLRKYKPQVTVAQDFNGEYGHGTHMLTAKLMQDAITITDDSTIYPESYNTYGGCTVLKSYFHLYNDNRIVLECHTPLSAFNGMTAIEVAKAAYKQHVSQQWTWFHVSDTSIYSFNRFGLYSSEVGADTSNDIMEHIVSYEQQELIEKEKAAEKHRQKIQELTTKLITAIYYFSVSIF